MSKRTQPFYALTLPSDAEARAAAQKIANRVGREVAVTDEDGNEVCRVKPTEPIILPKS